MKIVLFLLSFCFVALNAFSQDFRVSGVVSFEGEPLPEVIIRVKGSEKFTQTNAAGEYSLQLQKGQYTLIFSFGNKKIHQLELTKDTILNIDMSEAEEVLDEVFLSAVRVSAQSPITYSNLSHEEIENRNLGQDIPALMQYLPGVVTTSDAGGGIGHSSIRVRGTEARGINVTINGIPYNDSESQGTFWVNIGDFASSVQNLQLQRGVGTSTNGAGAFGASLNILTDTYKYKPSAELANSFGSYNTHKHTLKFSTGIFDNHWEFSGRASVIKSDGYIDRASSDLKSYFFQGSYIGETTLVKALTFGGSQVTYQAWDGIDAETLKTNRRYNPAGAYIDDEGQQQFYKNHNDEYKQDHFQLLWNERYGNGWSSNIGLHYTYGRGFYESYRAGKKLKEYGLKPFEFDGEEVTRTDLITKKWLVNDFYGTTFNVQYQQKGLEVVAGGAWNHYVGDHFGEITYARFAPSLPLQNYYDNTAKKTDFNFFGKATYALSEALSFYGDLQFRRINYEIEGVEEEEVPFVVNDYHNFFNPKAGLTYTFSPSSRLYFSFARAQREPNRSDYQNGDPQPEELNDYELGWRYLSEKFQLNSNIYYMDYQNQLVVTGELTDTGAPIRKNSGSSYRLGLELDATVKFHPKFFWRPNVAISQNKNDEWFAEWDGELRNFGKTNISFSPSVVAGNIFEYQPVQGLEIKFLTKYVGEQYLSNLENKGSKLDSYFVNDLNLQYTWQNAPVFKEIVFSGLINNIFSEEYVSNGYYFTYDIPAENGAGNVQTEEGAGYYPQATRNFLAGITLKF